MSRTSTVMILAWALASASFARAQPAGDPLALQARDVLVKHCFDCHGKNPKKLKGALNLFDRAHLVDKERKILIAKKPDESALIQQVESGDMPPGERPKLSPAEKKILRDWISAGGAAFPLDKTTSVPEIQAPPAERAAQVKEILRLRCFECHGGSKTQAGVKILDHPRLLAKKHVVPGKPDESPLFELITATDNSAMPPPGQPRLNQSELDTIRLWIAEGAAAFPADVAVPAEPKRDPSFKDVVGVDYVHKRILAHVRATRTEDRPFKRYFSINHILTSGATANELELQREALAKAINHLSWQAQIVQPLAIDPPVRTIFCIDLRDLGWNEQPFQRWSAGKNLGRSELNIFDIALLEYPYAIAHEDSETFERLIEEFLVPARQVRPIVYVRADWFVSTMTQPTIYEDFLRLPFELKELETKLGVDSERNLRDYVAKRGGMSVSGVSVSNRVVERHPAKYGAYWKSFDFRSSKGQENIFIDPINLHPGGGEMIFNLPNGLQGYFITNANGIRVDAAPTEIVVDKFAEDKIVRNGLACMRCHDRGMKDFSDAMRPALLRLPGSPGFDKRIALQLYPEQPILDELLQADRERFLAAMAKVNGKPLVREPLIPVSHRFLDDPILMNTAAGELGLADPTGLHAVFRSPQFTALGLMPLPAQGVVRRDAWADYFDQVVRALGLGIPIVPVDGLSRASFPAGPPPFEVELKTNKKNNTFAPGDELVILVTNKSAKPIYMELIGRSARGQLVVLAPSTTTIAPKETYRFPQQGAIKIRGGLGKEQIILFASQAEFAPGELLRGQGVTDRVVHPFFLLRRADKRVRVVNDPFQLVKKTIDIETK